MKQSIRASRALAELKGVAQSIPNERILVNTLILTEAKESSAVENIVTTHDELFRAQALGYDIESSPTKEVLNYATALQTGFDAVEAAGIIRHSDIKAVQRILEGNNAGYRTQSGTSLKNQRGEIVYVPPQRSEDILRAMDNLLAYINNTEADELDPLVKMAIIHFQFESIHPFYDGNGRTGRILNILYLHLNGLLDYPILYLSRYIIQNKLDYYRLLQAVREEGVWEEWIIYLLRGVEQTAIATIEMIKSIRALMQEYKRHIRTHAPQIYSKDLLENLFKHPYTRIEFLKQDIQKTRQTAAQYLETLIEIGLLQKVRHGKHNYYINTRLFTLFA